MSRDDIHKKKLGLNQPTEISKPFVMDDDNIDRIADDLVNQVIEDCAPLMQNLLDEKQALSDKQCATKKLKIPGPPKPPKLPFNLRVDLALEKLFTCLQVQMKSLIPLSNDADDAEQLATSLINEAMKDIETAHQTKYGKLKIAGSPIALDPKLIIEKAKAMINSWRTYTDRNGRNFEPKLEFDVRNKGRDICNTDSIDKDIIEHAINDILQSLLVDAVRSQSKCCELLGIF